MWPLNNGTALPGPDLDCLSPQETNIHIHKLPLKLLSVNGRNVREGVSEGGGMYFFLPKNSFFCH